jgi:hypothetical protein
VTAPDARYNLVQWIPWDGGGHAYADLLIDPRSGVSLHGQAYMHSGFVFKGRARARALLRTLRTTAEAKPEKPPKLERSEMAPPLPSQGVPLFSSARTCEIDSSEYARNYATGLEALLATEGLDDKTAKHVSQDYVRFVIAHEVGHLLGLRHNFAGSLAGTLSRKEIDAWFKAYTTNADSDLHADRYSTSSVMEYSGFKASLFAGAQIRRTKTVFPHDKAAIRWGYFNDTEAIEQKLLFATDNDLGVYGDVLPWDFGTEPVLSSYGNISELLKNLPNIIIESYIQAKAPEDPRDQRALETVNLRPDDFIGMIQHEFNSMLKWFKASSRSLRVENTFPFKGDLNRKEIFLAHWRALNQQIDKLGGIDRTFFSYLPIDLKLEQKGEPKEVDAIEKIDAQKLTDRLGALLESADYSTFVGLDDKSYSFTKEEKELIKTQGKKFFLEFEKRMIKGACLTLEKSQRDLGVQTLESVGEDDIVAKLERRIIDLAREVILKRNDDERRSGKVDKAFVEVSEFRYDLETRLAAARILTDTTGSFKGWSVDAKSELHKQLKESIDASLNIQNFKSFQDSQLSRPLRDWYLNQQTVLGLLPQKPNQPVSPPNPGPGR